MAERKRHSQYQYEPLVTPEKWTGEERGFAVRLTQILDELYAKFSGQKETARAEKAEMENSISRTHEELAALNQTVSSLKKEIVNSSFPVGSCYTTATNTNPATILGLGTWTLIDKVFARANVTSGFFEYNATNASAAGDFSAIRSGHSTRIHLSVTPSVALSTSSVQLGTFDLAALGFSHLTASFEVIGGSSGGNAVFYGDINSSTGVLTHNRSVTRTSGGSLAAGNKIYFDILLKSAGQNMLDSACDQFIWKRTA